MKSRVEKIVYF